MSETKQLSHYIDGQWVAGSPASDSLNPSDTRDVVAKVPGGDKKIVDAAVAAAKAAFPAWANASPEVRSDLLDKVGSTIMARADELGRLLSREERSAEHTSELQSLRQLVCRLLLATKRI